MPSELYSGVDVLRPGPLQDHQGPLEHLPLVKSFSPVRATSSSLCSIACPGFGESRSCLTCNSELVPHRHGPVVARRRLLVAARRKSSRVHSSPYTPSHSTLGNSIPRNEGGQRGPGLDPDDAWESQEWSLTSAEGPYAGHPITGRPIPGRPIPGHPIPRNEGGQRGPGKALMMLANIMNGRSLQQ